MSSGRADALELLCLHGGDIAAHLPVLARLRMQVFREFPYLYQGDEAYERDYLATYVNAPDSLVVLVRDGDRTVGATSALPLADEVAELRAPFEAAGDDVAAIFYCGESVLLPAYRGRGLGVRFFELREAHARGLGRFDTICFCAVQRPHDHPRRPAEYQPLDAFWQRRGYRRREDRVTTFTWRDLDEDAPTAKTMVFWSKPLGPPT